MRSPMDPAASGQGQGTVVSEMRPAHSCVKDNPVRLSRISVRTPHLVVPTEGKARTRTMI